MRLLKMRFAAALTQRRALRTTSVAELTVDSIPPIRTCSNAIADILSAYDDLIENNRRRIALLEEAARMLYREWFVHFRFPGHEHVKIIDGIPKGGNDGRSLGAAVRYSVGRYRYSSAELRRHRMVSLLLTWNVHRAS